MAMEWVNNNSAWLKQRADALYRASQNPPMYYRSRNHERDLSLATDHNQGVGHVLGKSELEGMAGSVMERYYVVKAQEDAAQSAAAQRKPIDEFLTLAGKVDSLTPTEINDAISRADSLLQNTSLSGEQKSSIENARLSLNKKINEFALAGNKPAKEAVSGAGSQEELSNILRSLADTSKFGRERVMQNIMQNMKQQKLTGQIEQPLFSAPIKDTAPTRSAAGTVAQQIKTNAAEASSVISDSGISVSTKQPGLKRVPLAPTTTPTVPTPPEIPTVLTQAQKDQMINNYNSSQYKNDPAWMLYFSKLNSTPVTA